MTDTFPSCLNDAGQAHVTSEIERLGLGWDAPATMSDIEQKPDFMDLKEGGSIEYEISNNKAKQAGIGSGGYGVFATIEIVADEHVRFDKLSLS